MNWPWNFCFFWSFYPQSKTRIIRENGWKMLYEPGVQLLHGYLTSGRPIFFTIFGTISQIIENWPNFFLIWPHKIFLILPQILPLWRHPRGHRTGRTSCPRWTTGPTRWCRGCPCRPRGPCRRRPTRRACSWTRTTSWRPRPTWKSWRSCGCPPGTSATWGTHGFPTLQKTQSVPLFGKNRKYFHLQKSNDKNVFHF